MKISFLVSVALAALSQAIVLDTRTDITAVPVKQGFIDFCVKGSNATYHTWYQTYGDLRTWKKTPLVLLHGGPGIPHQYLDSLSVFAQNYQIPVILYDQLGCGNSTHLPDKLGDTSFWTVQLFLDELANLLTHLGISSNYNLLGHSWGGMLAASHAVLRPKGLKKLVLMSAPASMALWIQAQAYWRSQLPQDEQDILNEHEADGTTDDPEYQAVVQDYYNLHICRLPVWPDDLVDSLNALNTDDTVYLTMNGPNEFFVTGSLKNWTIIDDIPKIAVPTLVLNGEFDEAQDIVVQPFVNSIPDVRWTKFANCSHTSHLENPTKYVATVKAFLDP